MKYRRPGRFNLIFLLQRIGTDIRLLFAMLRDMARGRYRKIPYTALLALFIAVAYIGFPMDFLPDVIPGYGQIDDALVALLCLYLMEKDLQVYKDWSK